MIYIYISDTYIYIYITFLLTIFALLLKYGHAVCWRVERSLQPHDNSEMASKINNQRHYDDPQLYMTTINHRDKFYFLSDKRNDTKKTTE